MFSNSVRPFSASFSKRLKIFANLGQIHTNPGTFDDIRPRVANHFFVLFRVLGLYPRKLIDRRAPREVFRERCSERGGPREVF